jgi:hypothetical protein
MNKCDYGYSGFFSFSLLDKDRKLELGIVSFCRIYIYMYSLSVILVSLVSLATNKGIGRKQNYLYFCI